MKKNTVGARHALPLLGILALGLVFGFGLAGCKSDSAAGDAHLIAGNWIKSGDTAVALVVSQDGTITSVKNPSTKITYYATTATQGTIAMDGSSGTWTIKEATPLTLTITFTGSASANSGKFYRYQ